MGAQQQLPLVIMVHGGGFATGTNKSQWKDRAPELASYGFVVACPDYRVGNSAYPTSATVRTLIVQGMQDSRAVVRFFRQDIAQGNKYHIDPKRIFLGGFSAGAIVTGQAVYLDSLSKADAELRKVIVAQGGLEGNGGHPGYDSSVTAWINMGGALIDPKYITAANSKPMISIYAIPMIPLSIQVTATSCRQTAKAAGGEACQSEQNLWVWTTAGCFPSSTGTIPLPWISGSSHWLGLWLSFTLLIEASLSAPAPTSHDTSKSLCVPTRINHHRVTVIPLLAVRAIIQGLLTSKTLSPCLTVPPGRWDPDSVPEADASSTSESCLRDF